jgi:nicotinamide-nucleotide amidase
MGARLRVSIVVIGDEILGGFVADTNSGWLAQRIRGHGVPLDRIVTVPDELDAIAEAVTGELGRPRPRLVLTSGGIGSTPDDRTFEAVAACLGLDLVVQPDIDDRITAALEWSAQLGVHPDEAHERSMRKMARVPAGARLLPGSGSFTPGIALDLDGGAGADGGATVVMFPGVPGELRRIMEEGVEPALLAGRGQDVHVAEVRHPYPESTLNPVLDRLVAEFPDVHLGSYPGTECTVRLIGARERVEEARGVLELFLSEFGADPAAQRLSEAWQARWPA